MLNLDRLRVLVALADHGSVAAAARSLHLSESAVSQQLSKLQQEIGCDLLAKAGRRLVFTTAGDALVDQGRTLLDEANRVVDSVRTPQDDVTGKVVVGAFATAARAVVTPALAELRAYDRLDVGLVEVEPEHSVPMVLRGDLDIAISNDWSDDSRPDDRLRRTHLLDDPVIVAMPRGHRLAKRRTLDLPDLATERWIAWPQGTLCRRWLIGALQPLGPLTIAHTAGEHSTQLALVAAGEGIAVLPRLGLPHEVADVAVVTLRDPLYRRVEALTRVHAASHPAVRATLSALQDAAAAATT